jgi:hypothetical protein
MKKSNLTYALFLAIMVASVFAFVASISLAGAKTRELKTLEKAFVAIVASNQDALVAMLTTSIDGFANVIPSMNRSWQALASSSAGSIKLIYEGSTSLTSNAVSLAKKSISGSYFSSGNYVMHSFIPSSSGNIAVVSTSSPAILAGYYSLRRELLILGGIITLLSFASFYLFAEYRSSQNVFLQKKLFALVSQNLSQTRKEMILQNLPFFSAFKPTFDKVKKELDSGVLAKQSLNNYPIIICDKNFRISYINYKAEKMLPLSIGLDLLEASPSLEKNKAVYLASMNEKITDALEISGSIIEGDIYILRSSNLNFNGLHIHINKVNGSRIVASSNDNQKSSIDLSKYYSNQWTQV